MNLNQYILGKKKDDFVYFYEFGVLRRGKLPNILHLMLKVEEKERISSLKLALICQADELLVKSKIRNPFPELFKPEIKIIDPNKVVEISYKIRNL